MDFFRQLQQAQEPEGIPRKPLGTIDCYGQTTP